MNRSGAVRKEEIAPARKSPAKTSVTEDIKKIRLGLATTLYQLATSGRMSDADCHDIAQQAAIEAFDTLSRTLTLYSGTAEFDAIEEWGGSSEPEPPATPILSDERVRKRLSDCASELRGCRAVPAPLREGLAALLSEVGEGNPEEVVSLKADCDIAIRALKAAKPKAH